MEPRWEQKRRSRSKRWKRRKRSQRKRVKERGKRDQFAKHTHAGGLVI